MQTQCPHCKKIFTVTAAHLNIAQGHVHCSNCQNVFNATHNLLKQLPKLVISEPESPKIPTELKKIPTEVKKIPTELKTTIFKPQKDHVYESFQEALQEITKEKELQEEDYKPNGQTWASFIAWGIIVILLSGTLAAQAMWYWQRDVLLQSPNIRPWLVRFCYTFLCRLPPTRDLSSFQIENYLFKIQPDKKDTIQLEAVFINKATFPQPYPDLQITFMDNNENILEQRRFKAADYLQKLPYKKNRYRAIKQMRAGASVHIKLDLTDMTTIKGNKISESYRFEFF